MVTGHRRHLHKRVPALLLFRVHFVDDVAVIEFMVPGISENQALKELSDRLHEVVGRSDSKKIVVDMSTLSFVASPVMGTLVSLSQFAEALNGQLVLCGVRPQIRQIFKFSNLDRLLTFHDSRAEALEALLAPSG